MEVEFLVHGTLSKGQTFWKKIDNDYCKQFYIPSHTCCVVLDVEVAKRESGGLSSYYNYLRYNNVSSSRTGSYFGMTLRIDDAICIDVKNMFYLLDTIFNKCIVGSILTPSNNGYNYVCQDSFEEKNKELCEIENKVANLFKSTFISTHDYVKIPSNFSRKSATKNINVEDLSLELSKDNLQAGNKLSVSPFYTSVLSESALSKINVINNEANKKIRDVQEECNRKLQDKEQEIERASKAASSEKTRHQTEIEDLERKLQSKQAELEKEKINNRKKEVYADINKTSKELKESISKLSGLLAERFPETNRFGGEDYGDNSDRDGKHRKRSIISQYWKEMGATAVLVILLAIISWNYFDLGNPFIASTDESQIREFQSKIKQKDAEIQSLNENLDNLKRRIKDLEETTPTLKELSPDYDWTTDYRIDVNIVGNGFERGKTYKFNICKKTGGKVNNGSPFDGVWKINNQDCEGNKYTIPSDAELDADIIISYYVKGSEKLSRSIKIIK